MLRRLKVLVVEDSKTSFAAIRLAMHRMTDWSIDHAGDTAAAIRLCAALKPDVVTLDLNLPDGGGLDLLAQIKTQFDVPIVVVSASTYEGSPVTAEALKRGADACFDKTHILTDAQAFLLALSEASRPVVKRRRRSAA